MSEYCIDAGFCICYNDYNKNTVLLQIQSGGQTYEKENFQTNRLYPVNCNVP